MSDLPTAKPASQEKLVQSVLLAVSKPDERRDPAAARTWSDLVSVAAEMVAKGSRMEIITDGCWQIPLESELHHFARLVDLARQRGLSYKATFF
jgi:hypothetical protein